MDDYKRVERTVVFVEASRKPPKQGPWNYSPALLLNPCDGYHKVYARFDGEGEFYGFFDWADSTPYTDDFYVAWALLPDSVQLSNIFDPKRAARRAALSSQESPNV